MCSSSSEGKFWREILCFIAFCNGQDQQGGSLSSRVSADSSAEQQLSVFPPHYKCIFPLLKPVSLVRLQTRTLCLPLCYLQDWSFEHDSLPRLVINGRLQASQRTGVFGLRGSVCVRVCICLTFKPDCCRVLMSHVLWKYVNGRIRKWGQSCGLCAVCLKTHTHTNTLFFWRLSYYYYRQ